MRGVVALMAGVLLVGPQAASADPVASWTGFYAGINAGVAGSSQIGRAYVDGIDIGAPTGGFDGAGLLAGGTVGWNWQAPNGFVAGVEGDFSWAGVGATTPPISEGGICDLPCRNDVNWLATLRGRLGKTFGDHLVYATAGAAFASGHSWQYFPPPYGLNFDETGIRKGWTAGAGFEAPVGKGWTLKAEYLYVDLGTGTCTPFLFPPRCSAFDTRLNVLRAGFNRHF